MSLATEEEGTMAEKDKTTKTTETTVERDRYTEPREKADPDHKDAGQQYVEQNPSSSDEEQDAKA